MTSDIAIVGAGITGLSIAFHLAERGAGSIVVYEREGIGAGASGVQPGGVRQQWSTRLNCVMARDSLAFYARLEERLEARVDPVFRRCGYAFVAHESETLERLRADVAMQNAVGVPSRLATAEEAAELVPGLRVEGIAGVSFCADDGYFDRPQAVVEAFAEAARRLGAAVVHADVRDIEPVRSGWRLTFADGTRSEAHGLVVAASVDTPAPDRRRPPDRPGRPVALLQRADRGAATRSSGDRRGPSLRRQAARRRPRARERPRRYRRRRRKVGALAAPRPAGR